jgi:hypothetical protein
MIDLGHVLRDIFDSYYSWAHLPYVLFVLSTLMRNIVWLRGVAVVAGLLRIVIRAFIIYDPVTVLWESLLVVVNIGQLLLIWRDSRHAHHEEHERHLLGTVLPGVRGRSARQLLDLADWRKVETGSELMREGEGVPSLMFVSDGAARIERNGELVAICSRGDFLGEMSFINGGGASATVVADRPMLVASFDSGRLRALIEGHHDLRYALEASFNRNLSGKLMRPAPKAAGGA